MADVNAVKEITAKLETGVKELFESEKYAEYLQTMSRFHRYSTRNTLLIHLQLPKATHVAGYGAWKQKFNRQVKKGEHGIKIFAPMPFVVKEELAVLDPVTKQPVIGEDGHPLTEEYVKLQSARFKIVSVFDVSQTTGDPLPVLAETLTGNVEHYELFMDALRAVSPLPIVFESLPSDVDGTCYFGDRIAIREGMSEIQTVSAAIHEITHAKLHDLQLVTDNGDKPKDRRTEEVEAESVSYSVCQYYGIDTGANTFGYIAEWSRGRELKELNASLDTIRKTTASLIDSIDEQYRTLAKERGQRDAAPDVAHGAGRELEIAESTANADQTPDYDVMNDREEMIRRIIDDTLKHDPEFPQKAIDGMIEDYRSASMEGLREAYLFYFPNDPPTLEQEPPSTDEPPSESAAKADTSNLLSDYARNAAVSNYNVGGNVLLMPVFIDGSYNRTGKKIRVTVEDPAGKYQLFSREEHGDTAMYFMTASGRLDRTSQYFDRDWDESQREWVNHHPSEAELDAVIPQIAEQFERDMAEPEKWAMYQHAAVVNRLDECDAHNAPVRELREARRQAEAQERARQELAIRQDHINAFDASVDDLADTFAKNGKADIELDRNLDKNPLFTLFERYDVDLPLATKGWVNRNLRAVQVKPDGTVSIWTKKGAKTSETFCQAIRKLTAAITADRAAREADAETPAAQTNLTSEVDKFLEDIGGIGNLFGKPTPPPKERTYTMENKLYAKFTALFPEFMNGEYSTLRLEAEHAKPLTLEWVFGDMLSIAHTYEHDGKPAVEPLVMFKVNGEQKTMSAYLLEITDPPRKDSVYSETGSPDLEMQSNIRDFTDKWLDKIEKQGFKPIEATLWNDGKVSDADIKVTFDKDGNRITPEAAEPKAPTLDMSLPDPSVGLSEMNLYGYNGDGVMLPLLQGRAVELFDADHAIYLLYPDNTEAMAFDRDEILGHDGLFGIERTDWERSSILAAQLAVAETSEGSRESELLYGDGNRFAIYQIPSGIDEARDFRFAPMRELEAHGLTVDRANYELVYTGENDIIDTQMSLDKIYADFQNGSAWCPSDYNFRSVSVSDVIVLQTDGQISSHFVDSIGFVEIDGFLGNETPHKPERTAPTVAELESDAKAGKVISLTDLSKAVNAERRPVAQKTKPSLLEKLERGKQRAAQQGQPDASKSNSREV